MKNISSLVLVLLCLLSSNSGIAGLFGLTHHSRANCINNESISWDYTEGHSLWVSSQHKSFFFPGRPYEQLIEDHRLTGGSMKYYPKETFDGAKAVHWGEGRLFNDGSFYAWEVKGIHKFPVNQDFRKIKTVITKTRDCDILNGWLGS